MWQRLKYLTIIGLTVVYSSFMCMPAVSAATFASVDNGEACAGLNALQNGSNSTTCDKSSGKALNGIIRFTINILGAVVGFAAVLMIIIAGFKYITANGDSSAISSARNTITYALVGLIIVALSQVLVHFVLSKTANSAPCPTNSKISVGDKKC